MIKITDKGGEDMTNELSVNEKRPRKKLFGVIICISVIAAVLLLNIALGVISYKRLLYIDLTQPKYLSMEQFFTPSESFISVMESDVIPSIDKINEDRAGEGLSPLRTEIIFCMDSDKLESDTYTQLVHHTARELVSRYPEHFVIKYTDSQKNPSSVQAYKITGATRIYSTDVIVTFGSEFVVHGLNSFFMMDNDTGELWGYNGEKKFASTILSLTRADSPVCAITTNHGEKLFETKNGKLSVKDEYSSFIKIIQGAGYRVEFIDFENDDIPENCRMIVCFAPTSDFRGFGNLGESGVSEIEKLDRYLDNSKSFFYICDPDTPELTNLDEYLSEWGVSQSRDTTASGLVENYTLFDKENSIDAAGSLIKGKYATSGYGASITADLRALSYPPAALFGSASSFTPSSLYEKSVVLPSENSESGEKSTIYTYYHNGINRTMYNVFTSEVTAYATVGESTRYASENNLYSLFTLTEELKQVQEDSLSMANFSSYVLGLSSTDFLKNQYIDSSSYGNGDILLAALRATSSEAVAVSIDSKAFYTASINDTLFALTDKTTPVLILTLAPLLVCAAVGGVVCIRRKYL